MSSKLNIVLKEKKCLRKSVESIGRRYVLILNKHKVKEERNVVQEVFLKIKEKDSKRKQVHSSIHKL